MAYKFNNDGLRKKYKTYVRWFVALVLVGGVFALIIPRIRGEVSMTASGWNWIGYAVWAVALIVAILQQNIKKQDKKIGLNTPNTFNPNKYRR
jgi:hypothetical protein